MDKRVKLIDFAPLQRGFDLPNSELRTGEYPVVYSNGVRNFHAEYMIKGPGVVTGRSGTIGNVHYVDGNYWPHNTSLWVTDFKGNHPKYVYYVYKAINYGKYNSGSGVPTLNRNDIHHEFVFCPPLPEQKAIANILQSWDTAIEKTEALIAAKEKQFDILTRNHISVRQSSSSWQPNTIGNIFDIKTYSSKSSLIKDEGPYYIVDMGSISRKGNLIKTKKTNTLIDPLNENDLVMPKDDIGGGNIIGKVAIIEKNGAFSCGDHVYRLVLKNNSYDPHFLKYLINCPAINRRLRAKANGTSQLGLGKKDLVKQPIRLPSIQEQRVIAELLNTAKRETDILKTLADQYRTQKRGLMQKLLTGKWKVKA